MSRRRNKVPEYSRPWTIYYYAQGILAQDNWSAHGCAKELMNAKSAAVVRLIREYWHSAKIIDRYTGRVVCRLARTKQGITVT